MSSPQRVPCPKCKALILPATAAITGGLCMPCHKLATSPPDSERTTEPSHFGGLGAGKGWLQTDFLVSKEELGNLLQRHSLKLGITNRRVEKPYESTLLDDYLADYGKYLDFIFSGKEFIRKDHYSLRDPIQTALFMATHQVEFREFNHKGTLFKTAVCTEPVPSLSPSMIYWSGREPSLRIMNEQGYFGLTLQFPKVYFSSDDGFTAPIETSGRPYHDLVMAITADIKKLCQTRQCRIGRKVFRPKILISDSMMGVINNHWYLQTNGLYFF